MKYRQLHDIPHDLPESEWHPQVWDAIIRCIKTQPHCWTEQFADGKRFLGTRCYWKPTMDHPLVFLYFNRIAVMHDDERRSPTRPESDRKLVVEVVGSRPNAMRITATSIGFQQQLEHEGGIYLRIPAEYLRKELKDDGLLRDLQLGLQKNERPRYETMHRISDLRLAIIKPFAAKPEMELTGIDLGATVTVNETSSYTVNGLPGDNSYGNGYDNAYQLRTDV